MANTSEADTNDSQYLLTLPEEDKEVFGENTENMAETLRRMIRSYNKVEDKYEIDKSLDEMNVIVLKTYKNAIEQNIQVMQSQVDKIDEELEKYAEEEEENQVLVEIDLDIAGKNL